MCWLIIQFIRLLHNSEQIMSKNSVRDDANAGSGEGSLSPTKSLC
jgi:hypothetical protein